MQKRKNIYLLKISFPLVLNVLAKLLIIEVIFDTNYVHRIAEAFKILGKKCCIKHIICNIPIENRKK
jgi:hypothetical protein